MKSDIGGRRFPGQRRSPHGERGLKLTYEEILGKLNKSLPAWGAWIEIVARVENHDEAGGRSPHGERGLKFVSEIKEAWDSSSLPAWGAWIEIIRKHGAYMTEGRSPHGERGLKLRFYITDDHNVSRSPHGERGLK